MSLRLFLCGDVMTGRGIDQALPHPVDPVLYEPYVRDAREYVDLAEKANGPIPRPLSFDYVWGEALQELERAPVDLRIMNLETAITSEETPWPDKGIHYRMHPLNIGCLSTARISACALANNHVLDWGYSGLSETLRSLDAVGIAHSGAGNNAEAAAAPAVLNVADKPRVLLFSFGSTTSGIPREWSATSSRAGVNLLDDLSDATAARVADQMRHLRKPGDLLIASIHWGSNWGYDIPSKQIAFAHRLVEEGVAIVHGTFLASCESDRGVQGSPDSLWLRRLSHRLRRDQWLRRVSRRSGADVLCRTGLADRSASVSATGSHANAPLSSGACIGRGCAPGFAIS